MPVDLQRRRDLGRILDDAFALYRAHWLTLVACTAVVVVPVQLLVFGAGLGWLTSGYDATPPIGDSLAGAAAQLLVVTPLVTAMTVHVVQRSAEGRRAAPGEAIRAGLDAFAMLVGPIALVALGVTVGLLFLVVPGVVLAVRWAVVAQAIVVERVTGTAALRRSTELVAGHGWFTFAVLLVANLLVTLLSLIFTIPLDLAAKSADSQSLVLLGQVLGQLLALPLVALAVTLLFFSLRAEGEQPRIESQPDFFAPRRDEGWEPPVSY